MKTVNATHSGYVTMILKDGKYHVTVSSATNTTTYILDESFVATCSFVTAGAALGKVITNEPVSTNTVYAVHGGNVTVVQTGDTWQVTVTHSNGTQTVYNDLNQIFVTSCSTVNEGDPIGSVDVVHVPDVSLVGINSITGGGDLTEDREFQFVNDEEEPGANKYYGTDDEGVRHWLPNIEPEVYTVNNGLTQEPGTNNFQLGGDLIKHTHLTQNFNLSVTDGTMSIGNAMNVSGARLHVEKDTSGVGIYSIKRGHIHSETGISVLGTRVVTTGGSWAGSVLAVGVYGELGFQGSGDFSFTGPKYVSFAGVNGVVTMYDGTGNLTSGISMYSGGAYYLNVATSNDVDNFAAIRAMFPIQTPGAEAFTGTVTNYYGLYIDPLNYTLFDITNRYAIYQAGTTDLNYYAGDIRFAKYPSTRNDGATLSALYVDASGNLKHGPIDVDMGGATENGGYFIWNQIAAQQPTSNFWISGNGKFDGQIIANKPLVADTDGVASQKIVIWGLTDTNYGGISANTAGRVVFSNGYPNVASGFAFNVNTTSVTTSALAISGDLGRITLGTLAGTGNRLVQADSTGLLSATLDVTTAFAPATGSGNYIWNQNATIQTANFKISGTGEAGYLTVLQPGVTSPGFLAGGQNLKIYANVGSSVSKAGIQVHNANTGADAQTGVWLYNAAGKSTAWYVDYLTNYATWIGADNGASNTSLRIIPSYAGVLEIYSNVNAGPIAHFNSANRDVTIHKLAGTGNRFVQADASGVLSATATMENGGSYIWNQQAVLQIGAFRVGTDSNNGLLWTGSAMYMSNNVSSANLEISKPSVGAGTFMTLKDSAGSIIFKGGASAAFLPMMQFTPSSTFGYGMIMVQTLDTVTSPALRIDARKSGGPLLTQPIFSVGSYTDEYLRVLAGGDVLIGTTTDRGTYKLQVNGAFNLGITDGSSSSIVYGTTSFIKPATFSSSIGLFTTGTGTNGAWSIIRMPSNAYYAATIGTIDGYTAGTGIFNSTGTMGIYYGGSYMASFIFDIQSEAANPKGTILFDYTNGAVQVWNKNGTIWMKSLNDSTGIAKMVVTTDGLLSYQAIPSGGGGSVTSVDASVTAATALSVTGGPITTSGTLAFSWTGANTQWVMGDGSLVTMPNSGNYIYNQNASSQTANYWINGLGRIDTALRINSSSTAYRFIVDNDHTASGYRVTGLVANAGSLTASLPLVGLYGAVGLTGGAATIGGNATANAGIYGVFAFKGSGTQTLNTVRGIYTSVMGHLQLGQSAGDVISGTGTAGFPSSFATWNTYYGTANIDRVAGFIINDPRQEAGLAAYTGTITNYYGIYIRNIGDSDILARITNRYAIFQSGSGDLNVFNGQIYAGNVPIYTTGDRQVLVRNVATGRLEYSDISFGRFGHVGEDVLATADRSFSVGAYQLTINSTGTTASSVFSVVRSGTSGNAISGTGTTSAPIIKANQGGGGSALWGSNSNNGIGVEGLSVGNTAVRGLRSTSGTNDFINVMEVMRGTTGTAANGIGGYINFQIVCNTTVQYSPAGHIGMKWTDATYATRTAAYEIWITNNAVTAKKFGIAGNGDTVVEEGDLEVKVNTKGLILQSPDGTRYRVTAANGGTLSIAAV